MVSKLRAVFQDKASGHRSGMDTGFQMSVPTGLIRHNLVHYQVFKPVFKSVFKLVFKPVFKPVFRYEMVKYQCLTPV